MRGTGRRERMKRRGVQWGGEAFIWDAVTRMFALFFKLCVYTQHIYIDTHTFWASIYVVNLNMYIYNYIYIHTYIVKNLPIANSNSYNFPLVVSPLS